MRATPTVRRSGASTGWTGPNASFGSASPQRHGLRRIEHGWLATGAHEGTITVQRLDDFEVVATLPAHPGQTIWRLAFLGKHLVTYAQDRQLKVWDVEKAEVLASQRVLLRDLAVHGEQLVVAVENELRFLDPTTLESKRALPAPDVTRIAVSGDRIATAGRDHTVRVFDGDRLVHAMRDRRETPRAFTWRGGLLAAGFEDGTVTVWDAEAGVEIATLWGHEGAVEAIDIAADETVVTASADGTIRLWDAPRTPGGNRFLRHAAWDRAGKRLAFACLRGGVYVYDAAGELLEHVLPDQRMQAVAFTPDGIAPRLRRRPDGVRVRHGAMAHSAPQGRRRRCAVDRLHGRTCRRGSGIPGLRPGPRHAHRGAIVSWIELVPRRGDSRRRRVPRSAERRTPARVARDGRNPLARERAAVARERRVEPGTERRWSRIRGKRLRGLWNAGNGEPLHDLPGNRGLGRVVQPGRQSASRWRAPVR